MDCCICNSLSKYKCPQCQYRTCSLSCVKAHKLVYGCSGISKPLKYIPIEEFTDNKLKKDMNFLMEIIRETGQSYKLVSKLSRSDNRKRFNFLLNECRSRGILIKTMPKAMTRHLHNTSMYDKVQKVIFWHIEWKIYKNDEILCEIEENSENSSIEELLTKAFLKFKTMAGFVLKFGSEKLESFRVLWLVDKEKLNDEIVENFKEVNLAGTLKEILPSLCDGNPIIEFPTFYLATSTQTPRILNKNK